MTLIPSVQCVSVVHQHLLGLPSVEEEMVLLTPVHKVLCYSSVLCVIVVCNESNEGRVVTELLQDTVVRAVSEVSSVEGEEKGREHHALRRPHTAGPDFRHLPVDLCSYPDLWS